LSELENVSMSVGWHDTAVNPLTVSWGKVIESFLPPNVIAVGMKTVEKH
jgi:hypothetical protein